MLLCHVSCVLLLISGGAAERPENSIAAFSHAVSLGSDLLELDVHLTRDGNRGSSYTGVIAITSSMGSR